MSFYLIKSFLWTARWLPYPVLIILSHFMGFFSMLIAKRRRHIAWVNLSLCFPQVHFLRRVGWLYAHFSLLSRSILDRGILWWASATRVKKLVQIEGAEHIWTCLNRQESVILLVPHFLGMEAVAMRLSLDMMLIDIFSQQKDAHLDSFMQRKRKRFSHRSKLFSRQDGIKKSLDAMKEPGSALFYLPDMDFGLKNAVFMPFFGVSAATLTATSRLAKLSQARVIPVIATMNWFGYKGRVLPAWDDFPGSSLEEDALRMNQLIEKEVNSIIPQYYWVHRRFKTRPAGEKSVYYG